MSSPHRCASLAAMDDAALSFCPVQLLSIALDGNRFKGEILPELERLKRSGTVRVIDLLVVRKDRSGAVAVLYATSADNFPQGARANGMALVTLAGKAGGIAGGGSGFVMLALPSLAGFFAALGAILIPAWLLIWSVGSRRRRLGGSP